MAVSIEEVYRSKRNNTNTATIILAKLVCDTASDLPSQSGLTGYILEQGCKADVISENKAYKIDSAGNWHVSGGEMWQNVYTESEIDSMMLTKQDVLTSSSTDLLTYLDTSLIDTANSAFEIRQYGKMCFARVSLKTITTALTGSDIISTTAIPSTLRPEKSIYPPLVARNYPAWGPSTLTQAAISIETNGNITLRTGAEKANAAYVIGYFSYYTG